MADQTKEPTERAPLSAARAPIASALTEIFRPAVERKEGIRVGFLGASGSGKTFAERAVVAAGLDRGVWDLVVCHDVKGRDPELDGPALTSPAALPAAAGVVSQSRRVVFRGDPRAGVECSADDVAGVALSLVRAERPMRVALVLNELDSALTDGGKSWTCAGVRVALTQGRALGLSVLWTTQQPHRVPAEPMDQATALLFFRLDTRAVAYLDRVLMFPGELLAALPGLDVGDFALWAPGSAWSGRIYRF